MKRLFTILSAMVLVGGIITSCEDLGTEDLTGGGTEDVKLSVTPASITIPAEGGSEVLSLTAPAAWSASSSESWLTISPGEGAEGNATITITAEANTSDQRQASVTVECSGSSATVTVIQAAAEGTEPGGDDPGSDDPGGNNGGDDPGSDDPGGNNGGNNGGDDNSGIDANAKWYICGDFTNWMADDAVEMTSNGRGIFTLEYTLPKNAQFKFIQDKSWDVNLGTVERETYEDATLDHTSPAISSGETVNLTINGYNLYFPAGGDVTVTLDVENETAVIESKNPGGEDPGTTTHTWYVVGEFNNWDAGSGIAMEDIGNGCYFASVTLTEDADEFKFLQDKSWDVNFGLIESAFMQQGTSYGLTADGYNLMTAVLGTFNIYFYPEEALVYYNAVSISGDNPNYQLDYQWYVVGAMTGNWDLAQGILMDGPDGDGNFTAAITVTADENTFKFVANQSWAVNYGVGPDGSTSTVTADTVYDAVSYGGNIQIATPGTYQVFFNYSAKTFRYTALGGSGDTDGGGTEGFGRGDEYDMN